MVGALLLKRLYPRAFEMMNQKDVAGLMSGWAENGVLEFPGHTPVSGRYEGKQAIEGFFRRMFDRMATIHFTVKRVAVARPFALRLTNIVLCEWALDETSYDGVTIHVEGITVAQVHQGRGIAARDYIFDTTPLEKMWGRVEAMSAAAELVGTQP